MAELDYGAHPAAEPVEGYTLGAGAFINILGGVVSLALIGGILVWGYQIVARDVSGVPVVQALDGPMRKAPEAPGGRPADHQGLSVNEIAAQGTASAPRDRLVLAPAALTLADEDAAQSTLASVPAEQSVEENAAGVSVTELEAAEQPSEAELIAQLLAEAATPLEPVEQVEGEAQVVASLAPLEVAPTARDLGPGVTRSLRPQVRPQRAEAATVEPVAARTSSIDVDPATLPAGTRLVQLGAFDSEDVARSEWDRLNGRFSDFMAGKSRVIQRATKAGRTFYRLRAHGFDDVADARRFCSALVAQNAACIPVLTQ